MKQVKDLMKFLFSHQGRYSDIGLLLMRFCGAFMILHGWEKFTNFSEGSADWPDPFHVGTKASYALTVFAELFCAIMVMLGLFTRATLIPLIILMLVIVFIIHSDDTFADREHVIMYLLVYLSLFFTGPGKYSIDRLIQKGKH